MALHSQPTKDRYLGFVFLLITSIGWGLNWPVIKLVLRDWPPLFARGTAGLVAGGSACFKTFVCCTAFQHAFRWEARFGCPQE